MILVIVRPVIIAVSLLIDNSVHDTHLDNVAQKVNIIEQMLGVFYDDLDRNIVTTFNPKSLIFIAAFLPQFINSANSLGLQFLIIVPTFLFITFTVTTVWALITGNIRDFLHESWALKPILRTAGGMMTVAGFGLSMARRVN
ncbi:LysE family transporter [uncultured Desulfobacter sp.]|uniref:LysE family translocator n=1 Tax=uncultured Desulfobacter sp. TaxID=240139 RepID=UPI002AAADC6D|nr:LysE family transporter [uncultured Desulfobacter sp.]